MYPDASGFSPQNIWYMRSFYMAWTAEVTKLQQPVGELDGKQLPSIICGLPWGHNLLLLSRIDNPPERLWYAHKAMEHGWSRNILSLQIERGLHKQRGRAVTNFSATLPPPQSDLASQTLRDPYVLDFLAVGKHAREREVEAALMIHIRRFLLELGAGFAFVGQQVPITVDGETYHLDLLFYHLRLRCFVIIELKTGKFKPEHAGKMNFYLSAVDDLLRHPEDRPSIGLILCKKRGRVSAEYALRDMRKPIGIAEWTLKLIESLPIEYRGRLPTISEIELEFKPTRRGKSA
jgi:predicted nuclease of restriction endonuclease-like (RecB) superfamily